MYGITKVAVERMGVYFKQKHGVTIQLTSDLPDSGVKSAHIHLYTARFFPLEQIRGNLNSYE